jgi:ABC-type branched-subunit amino acid transport system substrate-binding protein
MFHFLKPLSHSNPSPYLKLALSALVLMSLCACNKRSTPAPIRGESGLETTEIPSGRSEIKQVPLDAIGTTPEVDGMTKIALLIPVTGPQKALGTSLQNAAEMSLFDYADDKINLAIYDTQSTPAGADIAVQKALQEKASLILGPVFADAVPVVAQAARRNHLNVISFSNSRKIAGNGVFILGFSPEEQVKKILTFAIQRAKKAIAILIPKNSYGTLVEQEISRIRQENPGVSFDIIPYTDSKQASKDLNPLKTLKFDALFIPEGGPALSALVSSILYVGIPLDGVQLLGTGQWDDELVFQNHSLYGAWIVSPDPKERLTFNAKYKQAYGMPPERIATLAYDAVSMVTVLKRHMSPNFLSHQALTQSRGFDGIDGVFRFTQDGVAERKLTISEVTSSGLKVLQTPEASF